MPKCAECGAETDLHELDIPICPNCINARGRMAGFEEHPGLPSDTEDTEIQTAKEKYLNAIRVYGDALRRGVK
jgi:hypothetical protein